MKTEWLNSNVCWYKENTIVCKSELAYKQHDE